MQHTDTIIIGAGQAGLAASGALGERGVEHVVLERGRVAERWRTERWDSLRLLTPNWMNSLPGSPYSGPDIHGYMTAAEITSYFESYAGATVAPIEDATAVLRLEAHEGRFVVDTTSGRWSARNVIIATGWCDQPAVPDAAARLDGSIAQVTASTYRNPAMLPAGGVLVVGASATGLQLADELGRAGRRVLLAVGNHTRMPRTYRGMDIYWWLERTGTLDRTIGELPDPAAARREPSLQLVGHPDHRTLDLAALATAGVRLAGRLVDIDGQRAGFSDDLPATVATADARMARVLAAIDAHIVASRLSAEVLDPDPPRPLPTLSTPDSVHLRRSGITSVIWATGHRRTYPWLHVPVLDSAGEIRQYRGVTPVPGLYVLGQRFQHFRSSNFIYGVGRDAAFVADHLVSRCPSTLRP